MVCHTGEPFTRYAAGPMSRNGYCGIASTHSSPKTPKTRPAMALERRLVRVSTLTLGSLRGSHWLMHEAFVDARSMAAKTSVMMPNWVKTTVQRVLRECHSPERC